MHEDEVLFLRQIVREGGSLRQRLTFQQNARLVMPRARHLGERRRLRHDDGRRNPELLGVIGDRLRMIAGGHGDHAASRFLGRKRQQPVGGAALLERRSELQVLELDPDIGADDFGQRARGDEGRTGDAPGDAARGGFDGGEGDRARHHIESSS